ncbi:MAG: hypothetical protein AB7E42_05000 [Anaerotignaceae bacterium]
MGKWDEQVKAAEDDMRVKKKEKFIIEEANSYLRRGINHPHIVNSSNLTDAEKESLRIASEKAEYQDLLGKFNPKQGTLKVEHEHGFILMDLEGFKALPKAQQNKILKLGGQ